MEGGVKSASFKGAPPITHGGVVESWEKQQQTNFDTGEAMFWPDGKPKEHLRVVVQTGVVENEDDDGKRALYLKFKSANAVRDAIRASGARFLEKGGYLKLTYTHDGQKAPGSKGEPPKEYKADYTPAQGDLAPAAQVVKGDTDYVAALVAKGINAEGLTQEQVRTLYETIQGT
jgi:hypothetical protein